MLQLIEKIAQMISEILTTYLGPIADFLAGYVWNWPPQAPLLAILLLGTGLYVTVRLGFIQVRGFCHAFGIASGRYDDPNDAGDLKHYQALTTALSATIGIGNIAGVAIAIRLGGPGALFWMWLTAFFGMALKYIECTLALAYRKVHPDGSVSGGPMYYIELGMGKNWRWMAILFAACAAISSFGIGNMNQSNTMADQVQAQFHIHPIWTAAVCTFFVGLVIIGGIRRIGRVTAILAPFMTIVYVLGALTILLVSYRQIPDGFALIIKNAFAPEPLVGGAAGSFLMTLMWGIRRGLFSNEAGLGSAPIAHAAAKTTEPVREGLVASLGPFIDTLVICTMTGLVIVMTGVWKEKVERVLPLSSVEGVICETQAHDHDLQQLWRNMKISDKPQTINVIDGIPQGGAFVSLQAVIEQAMVKVDDNSPWNGTLSVSPAGSIQVVEGEGNPVIQGNVLLTGAPLTAQGFQTGLPGNWGNIIVTLAVLLFAVSTSISWSYYGDRATEYLLGSKAVPIYRWLFVFFFFIGAILPLEAVWTFGDMALGLMALPNLIALIFLTGTTVKMTKEYFSRDHVPYKKQAKLKKKHDK